MAKSKTYELLLKIGGKTDSSLKNACVAADKNLATLGDAAKKAGKIAVTALAAVATAAAGVALSSLTTYAEFEQAMANTAAIANATGEDYEALERAAREMGATTTKTATEAAQALGYMALAGWNTQQSIAGLEPILRLSEATQMDLATCSDLVTDSMSALGLGVEKMGDYLDLTVQTNNKANTTAQSLMEALIGCGGAAKTVGVDLTELSTALGVLANNGTKGAEAGTAMNAMLVRMTSKDAAIKAMKELGVSAFDSAGNFRGLENVLGDISDAMASMTTEQQAAYLSQIAGTNYYTEMSYLLDAVATSADGTANAWANLEGSLQGRDGALMNMAGQVTDTLTGAKDIFMSAVQEAQLTIGEQIAPYAQSALTYLANTTLPLITEKLGEIIPQLIEAAKWVGQHKDMILAVAAGIGAAVVAYKAAKLGMAAYNAVTSIHKIVTLASAGATLTAAQAAQMLNLKMLAIVGVIGLVVGAGVWLYQNWDMVKQKAAELGTKIGEIWSNISNAVNNAISAISERFPILGAYLQGFWNSIQDAWGNVQAIFTNIINFIDNVFSGNWSAAWDNIVAIFGNVFGLIVNLAKAPINGVISAINWVLDKVNGISVTIPDWVPGVGGQTLGFAIPTIPQLAVGGIATKPTLAEIGEGGEPEAVLPLSKLADLLAGKGGNGPGQDPKDGGGKIVFAPVMHFYGQTSKRDVEEATRTSFEEFKRLMDRWEREKQRKRFDPA